MKTPMRPTLRDLQIGDKFYPASQQNKKKKDVFEVVGRSVFNIRHGSPTRNCKNTLTKEIVSKSCRMEVIKLYYCLDCGKKVGHGETYCNECVVV